jgi:hypothetical protein
VDSAAHPCFLIMLLTSTCSSCLRISSEIQTVQVQVTEVVAEREMHLCATKAVEALESLP